MMTKKQNNLKRLETIAHYIGVVTEYIVVIYLAIWLNNTLKFPGLFSLPFNILGFALAALGLFFIAWSCWLQFTKGQGTTGFSESTRKLVTCGPYAITLDSLFARLWA